MRRAARAVGGGAAGPLEIRMDGATNTLWVTMLARHGGPQNFTPALLESLSAMLRRLQDAGGRWGAGGDALPVHYGVLRSAHPDYFSLGGDLARFHDCIARGDAAALRDYSMLCLDMMYGLATGLAQSVTTLALVQGRALGGGFETALSADYIVAEEHVEMGFPEILFGLFPCTGGMSLLGRRIGIHRAERIMASGRLYSAGELFEMGVVDEMCPTGSGIEAARTFIAAHATRRSGRMALQRARQRMMPLDYGELKTVVDDWVDTAMGLSTQELRVMDTLVRMQAGGVARG